MCSNSYMCGLTKSPELKEANFSEILDNKIMESSCNCNYYSNNISSSYDSITKI